MTLLIVLLATHLASASFHPADLRCEYLVNPLNIGTAQPRLSWIDEAATRNWQQKAYQIQVSQTPYGPPDLWDSGRIEARETTQIEYGVRSKGLNPDLAN